MSKNAIHIYTDGSCSSKKGKPGGWGALLIYGEHKKELSGCEWETTNQRMELKAPIEALRALKNRNLPTFVYSDSAYVVNGMNQRWYERWRQNGWLNSKKEGVENRDLWEALIEQAESMPQLSFVKVKGHAAVEHNESADQLAVQAMRSLMKSKKD